MKYTLLVYFSLSVMVLGGIQRPLDEYIPKFLKVDEYVCEGSEDSGIIISGGEVVGAYNFLRKKFKAQINLPSVDEIVSINFNDHGDIILPTKGENDKKVIGFLLKVLSDQSYQEENTFNIIRFEDGEKLEGSSQLGKPAYCDSGLYITLKNGSKVFIKGHKEDEFFTLIRASVENIDFRNIALKELLASELFGIYRNSEPVAGGDRTR